MKLLNYYVSLMNICYRSIGVLSLQQWLSIAIALRIALLLSKNDCGYG
jgi:hypothetical protein